MSIIRTNKIEDLSGNTVLSSTGTKWNMNVTSDLGVNTLSATTSLSTPKLTSMATLEADTTTGIINLPTGNKFKGYDKGSITAPGLILQRQVSQWTNLYSMVYPTTDTETTGDLSEGTYSDGGNHHRVTIMPMVATSKIHLTIELNANWTNTHVLHHFAFYDVTNGAYVAPLGNSSSGRRPIHFAYRAQAAYDSNDMGQMRFSLYTDANNLTSRTYALHGWAASGNTTYINHSNDSSNGWSWSGVSLMMAEEIAVEQQ